MAYSVLTNIRDTIDDRDIPGDDNEGHLFQVKLGSVTSVYDVIQTKDAWNSSVFTHLCTLNITIHGFE